MSNVFKTTFLLAVLTVMLVLLGGAVGGQGGMLVALIFAFVLNFVSYWFSDRMVLAMYGAQPVGEAEAPALHAMVRRLATKAGLPMPRIYMIDNDTPNAFATGRNPSHAAVAVTTGITRILKEDELEGVLAHELGHVLNRDMLIGTVAAMLAGAITYLAHMAQWAAIFGGRSDDDDRGSPVGMLLLAIVAPIAALIVQLAVSRAREYQADATGARRAGRASPLAGALGKLETAAQAVPMDATPATAHLFIVNPLSGESFARLFSTHPPIAERIARLRAMGLG
jgi:heat shock protein HtpX